jgi:hypothetical protein
MNVESMDLYVGMCKPPIYYILTHFETCGKPWSPWECPGGSFFSIFGTKQNCRIAKSLSECEPSVLIYIYT